MKKLLSLLIASAMLFSMVSVAVMAEEDNLESLTETETLQENETLQETETENSFEEESSEEEDVAEISLFSSPASEEESDTSQLAEVNTDPEILLVNNLETDATGISDRYPGGFTRDTSTFTAEAGYGSVIKSVEDSKKNGFRFDFSSSKVKISDNKCVEVEFDMMLTGKDANTTPSSGLKIQLNDSNGFIVSDVLASGMRFKGENLPDNSEIFRNITFNQMNHYKLVLQPSNGHWGLASLEINGTEKITALRVSKDITSDLSYVQIRYNSSNNTGDIVYADNVSVTTYPIPTDGQEPATPDRYSLFSKAQGAAASAKESYDNGEISENIYNSIVATSNAAFALLGRKPLGSETFADYSKKFTEAEAEVNKSASIITAYKAMKESGAKYIIDYKNAVVSGDITEDAEVSVSIPVYTAPGDANTTVKALGFLYQEDADLATPKLIDIVPVTKEINPDTPDEIEVPFDLSGYSDKSGLSYRVVAMETYASLASTLPEAMVTDTEDAVVGTEVTVSSNVDVTPKPEDSKIVYTLKGTAGSKVSLLIQKKGSSITDVEAKPKDVIEYYNTAVFNESGYAMFEFAPSVSGYYDYVIAYSDSTQPCEDKILYATTAYIDSVIDKFYDVTDPKTLDDLSDEEKDAITFNVSDIDAAKTAGGSIDNMLKETLVEKRYDSSTLKEFKDSFLFKLAAVTDFRTADSADAVMELIGTKYKDNAYVDEQLILALDADERQSAYVYLSNSENKKDIIDMATLNSEIADAATPANGDGESGSSEDSGTSSKPSSRPSTNGDGGKKSDGIVVSGGTPKEEDEEDEPTAMQKAEKKFTDLDSVEWAKSAIIEFAANGFVDGKAEGIFAPNDKITREEFVKLVVNVFGFYNENAQCTFADSASNDWHYSYIASAAEKGIVNGVSDTSFGVGEVVTRQDMAVILYRIAKMINLELTPDGEYIPFADEIHISDYAAEAVKELSKSGVINGAGNNSFLPLESATRAQAVKMIYEAYKLK